MAEIGPDDNLCKRCGEPVRYAYPAGAAMGAAFDAEPIAGAGYFLGEHEVDGVANGQWIAQYVKVADRDPEAMAYRKHSCKPTGLIYKDDRANLQIRVDVPWGRQSGFIPPPKIVFVQDGVERTFVYAGAKP